MNKHEQQRQIARRTERDTGITNGWLQQNGVNPDSLTHEPIQLLQAQRLATQTLRDSGFLLQQNEAHTLNNFLRATRSKKTRARITTAVCYKVLNIAKQAQRASAKYRKHRERQLER